MIEKWGTKQKTYEDLHAHHMRVAEVALGAINSEKYWRQLTSSTESQPQKMKQGLGLRL
jgi:hypothetical protein